MTFIDMCLLRRRWPAVAAFFCKRLCSLVWHECSASEPKIRVADSTVVGAVAAIPPHESG